MMLQFNPLASGVGGSPSNFRGMARRILDGEVRSLRDIRALTPLPDESQRLIDEIVVGVGLDRLVVVADALAENLTFPLSNWLGVTELYWEKQSKTGSAVRTMVPQTRGEGHLTDRTGVRYPVYLTMDNFDIGIRELLVSQRAGTPLDATGIEQATRRVLEAIEDAAINGGPTVAGNSSPGLLNAPNVNTYTYDNGTGGANSAWDVGAAKTGEEILIDVRAMADTLRADKKFGPYNLYVNASYGNALNKVYSDGTTTFDKTVRQMIEEMQYGGRGIRVREADLMPTNRTSLVQMSRDVIDVIVGDQPMPVSWEDGPGWTFHHAVMACLILRAKDDYDGGSGICNGNI